MLTVDGQAGMSLHPQDNLKLRRAQSTQKLVLPFGSNFLRYCAKNCVGDRVDFGLRIKAQNQESEIRNQVYSRFPAEFLEYSDWKCHNV
jgi:hypothetical protein